jgi:uncharacterized membrane protein
MAEPESTAEGARWADPHRVEAFSDGVFAITITLLVLELQPPHHHPGGLLDALLKQWPFYVAFVISFGYVGVIWLNHHALFRLIGRVDLGLNWANLALLLGAVIVPFPTATLATALAEGSRYDERVAVALYALTAALMSAPWLIIFWYLRRHPALLAPAVTPDYVRMQRVRPLTGIALYGLSGVVGWFVTPLLGVAAIAIMIVYHAVTSEGLREGPLGRLFRT